jgi:arabinogalactan endo-1,4-beta-galactosidase
MLYTGIFLLLLPLLAACLPSSQSHSTPFFYKGFDLSSLKIEEDGFGPGLGAIYKDTQRGNITRPAEDILGDGGMNAVRLRLWVYPKAPYDGTTFATFCLGCLQPYCTKHADAELS